MIFKDNYENKKNDFKSIDERLKHLEFESEYTVKRLEKRTNDLEIEMSQIYCCLDDSSIDRLINNYKYRKVLDIPQQLAQKFYKQYRITLECDGDYTWLYHDNKGLGTTHSCVGEIIDLIKEEY